MYSQDESVWNYAKNSVLFLTTVREKDVKMYDRFIEEIKLYSRVIRILSKGYLPISLLCAIKIGKNSKTSENSNCKIQQRLWSSSDKTLPIIWHEMKLVTFGIDNQRNLIVQFPVIAQTYTQKRLIMYQIETVPVPILDENEHAHLYTELKIEKPYISLNEETYKILHAQELKMCKKIGYKYYCEKLFVVKSKTSCTSAIYFNLESEVIKKTVNFCTTAIKQI